MKNWSLELRKHNKLSDKISPITKPLLETFNLAQFCYFSVDSKGNSAALSTHPKWIDYYMHHNLFKFNPFLKLPKLIPEGIFLSKGMKNSAYIQSFKHAESFGIFDSLTLTFRSKNKLTGFSFGLKSDIYNTYILNEVPLLKNYCYFFLKKASNIINNLESEPINVLSWLGKSFNTSHNQLFLHKNHQDKLLSLMGIKDPNLSQREKECLLHYLNGETGVSIAQKLGLSRRTVESYLDNIKIKLNCFDRTELIKKGHRLKDLRFLAP